jgi:hypothetical protein
MLTWTASTVDEDGNPAEIYDAEGTRYDFSVARVFEGQRAYNAVCWLKNGGTSKTIEHAPTAEAAREIAESWERAEVEGLRPLAGTTHAVLSNYRG